MERIRRLRIVWKNTYYRATIVYTAILVTIIFALQVKEYTSTGTDQCPVKASALTLVPVIGVFLSG